MLKTLCPGEKKLKYVPCYIYLTLDSAVLARTNSRAAILFYYRVSKLHHQPCHVVYTDYRPVPLQHYLFPAAAEGLFLVVDEKGKVGIDLCFHLVSDLIWFNVVITGVFFSLTVSR